MFSAMGQFFVICWVRFVIWLLAMIVATIPALHAAKIQLSGSIDRMALAVYHAGFFHDFYFVIIIAAIFGISNALYSIIFTEGRLSIWSILAFTTSIPFFLYATIAGILRFSELAHATTQLDPIQFNYDVGFI
jgi:hypothetical protein